MRAIARTMTAALLVASLAATVAACGGSGNTKQQGERTTTTSSNASVGVQSVAVTSTTMVVVDALSTFKSKDPFIARETAPPSTTSTTTAGGITTTTAAGGTTTTTQAPAPTITTTNQASNTLRSLKVLSIDVANGTPLVTFEVDDTVYEANREGDVVSTAWGQVKVLDIDADDQRVLFLHGSELRSMGVGQEYFK